MIMMSWNTLFKKPHYGWSIALRSAQNPIFLWRGFGGITKLVFGRCRDWNWAGNMANFNWATGAYLISNMEEEANHYLEKLLFISSGLLCRLLLSKVDFEYTNIFFSFTFTDDFKQLNMLQLSFKKLRTYFGTRANFWRETRVKRPPPLSHPLFLPSPSIPILHLLPSPGDLHFVCRTAGVKT